MLTDEGIRNCTIVQNNGDWLQKWESCLIHLGNRWTEWGGTESTNAASRKKSNETIFSFELNLVHVVADRSQLILIKDTEFSQSCQTAPQRKGVAVLEWMPISQMFPTCSDQLLTSKIANILPNVKPTNQAILLEI